MITAAELGRRVSVVRKERGVTQTEFGAPIGLDKGAISKWEKGERHLTFLQVAKLAEAWNFSTEALFAPIWDPTACFNPQGHTKANKVEQADQQP